VRDEVFLRQIDDGFLSEIFIVSSKSRSRLISCLLRDGVIFRLFGLGSKMETEGPGTKLSGAA
jgi:hypothetical protein